MVIDTTVLVDFFRENKDASKFLLSTDESLIISRVILMELIRGLKSKRQINIMIKQLNSLGIQILEITEQISKLAGELFEKYYHSHGLGVMDAIVAASAIVSDHKLATHNIKHFAFINTLNVLKPY